MSNARLVPGKANDDLWVDSGDNSTASWEELSDSDGSESGWDLVSVLSDVKSITSLVSDHRTPYRDALLARNVPFEDITSRKQQVRKTRPRSRYQQEKTSSSEIDDPAHDAEKPMVDKLRRKHKENGRKRFLRGHTGRWNTNHNVQELSEVALEAVVSPSAHKNGEEHLTALEVRLGNSKTGANLNLNKGRLWEVVPAVLSDEAYDTSQQKSLPSRAQSNSRPVSVFKLEVLKVKQTATGKEDAKLLREAERRERTIYFKPPGRPMIDSSKVAPKSVFAELTKEKPKNIPGQLLPWKLGHLNRKASGRVLGRKQTPVINGCLGLFVEDAPMCKANGMRRYIEVDLGQERAVVAVSTQGGPPPVRKYPEIDDLSYPNGETSYTTKRRYNGPHWTVYDPEINVSAREKKLQWVRSYELEWRAESGRDWYSLGTFKGNSDTTSEKANILASLGQAVHCRYLRFLPLSCEGQGAMRIGVYGNLNDQSMDASLDGHSSAKQVDEHVEYRLYHPSSYQAPNSEQRDRGAFSKSHSWGRQDWNSRRERRSLQTEVREAAMVSKEETNDHDV